MKRHRSAKTGEFVDAETAKESPDTTIAETVDVSPNIHVVPDIYLVDLEGAVRVLANEGVILGVCCQPDGRYTIIVEKADGK